MGYICHCMVFASLNMFSPFYIVLSRPSWRCQHQISAFACFWFQSEWYYSCNLYYFRCAVLFDGCTIYYFIGVLLTACLVDHSIFIAIVMQVKITAFLFQLQPCILATLFSLSFVLWIILTIMVVVLFFLSLKKDTRFVCVCVCLFVFILFIYFFVWWPSKRRLLNCLSSKPWSPQMRPTLTIYNPFSCKAIKVMHFHT